MTFDDTDFPPLPTATSDQQATMTTTAAQTSTNTNIPATSIAPYDYKAEMKRISTVIENDLKQQFAALFASMEQQIETLMKQHADNYAEQQKVNEFNTQQLGWVVDTLKSLLRTQNNGQSLTSPLLLRGNGHS